MLAALGPRGRKIVAWLKGRAEAFLDDHPGLVMLWLLGLPTLLVLALLDVRLPPDWSSLAALTLGPFGVDRRVAAAYPVIPLAVAYVVLVVASAVVALAWPVLRWVVLVGAWVWLFYESPLTGILIGAALVVVNFVYRAVMQHLANQRRIIAALEKQSGRQADKYEDKSG